MPRYPGLARAADGLSSGVYESLLDIAQQNAPEVFRLNVGDSYLSPAPSARSEQLTTARFGGLHNYAPVRGEPALLDAIEADLAARDRPVARDRLQITAGATSGLDLCCRTLLRPGDEVILPSPYWPLIRGMIRASGATPIELPIFPQLREPGFDLAQALERVVSERTVGIYLNSPHNPTGVVLTAGEIDAIARVVTRHGLWVFSDEAYDQLHFAERPGPAVWQHPQIAPRAMVAHTFSKTHGLAGARVGFVHGPSDAMQALSALQTHATYCAARPMQLLAAEALTTTDGRAWPAIARQSYRAAAEKATRALGLPCPEAGTFVLFDLRPHLRGEEEPSELLARIATAGVVLTPGAATGHDYSDYARLCYTAVTPQVLDRALAALSGVLYDP